MKQSGGIEGPPPSVTPVREQALASIGLIAALGPGAMAPSHGEPVRGEALRKRLRQRSDENAEQKWEAGSRA